MDVIRQHLFLIVCSVVGAAGIALGVTGFGSMSKIAEEMEEAKRLHDALSSLRSNPVNERWIDQEKRRIAGYAANYDAVVDRAKKLNPYEPLVEGLFPKGRPDLRYEFRRQYRTAMEDLMTKLKAGQRPTAVEIMDVEDEIFREQAQLKHASSASGVAEGDADWYTPAGVLTQAGALRTPAARAAIAKARRIYCYANPLDMEASSLHVHPAMADLDALDAPSPYDCWFAQVQLWIQTDVVDAIVRMNEEAADELIAQDNTPWLGVLPIKDIISLRVSEEYITDSASLGGGAGSGDPAGGRDIALPLLYSGDAMTGSYTDDSGEFQVMYFSLKVVMDQRDLPKLIQEICKDRFHSLLRVAYKALPENPQMTGRIYGSDPAINVVLDFETHMLGEIFIEIMPYSVYLKYYPE